ncbi:MAG: protein kinase [Bryobacteraceae bacterium]
MEARAASALDHPNIVTVYDVDRIEDIDFIAMEYVAGRTLDKLIPRRGLPVGEALNYAVPIAEALSVAHAAGIVHRDIKPTNIMVDEHGLIKVLDFGIAESTPRAHRDDGTSTETLESASIAEGRVIGTAAYMSPEQAQGGKVDARSDVFSFGSVLFEMVTGRRAFHKATLALTLEAIVSQKPGPIPESMPRDIRKLIVRCMQKDPRRRPQRMNDVRFALELLREEPESRGLGLTSPGGGRKSQLWPWVLALVGITALTATGLWFRRNPVPAPTATLQAFPLTTYTGYQSEPAFSPDGSQVAFVWDGPQHDNFDIYVKQIGMEGLARLTKDPAVEAGPAWSPEGHYIAFLRFLPGPKNQVILIPAIGGPERKLAETRSPCCSKARDVAGVEFLVHHLSWSPDGRWLALADKDAAGKLCVFLLSVETGEKRRLTSPPDGFGDVAPAFSPDGRHLSFVRANGLISDLYVAGMGAGFKGRGNPIRRTALQQFTASPAWTPDGRDIIFSSGTATWGPDLPSLWRVAGSGNVPPRSLLLTGDHPAVSRRGNRLAYRRSFFDSNIWRLDLHFPSGKGSPAPLIASTRQDGVPQYSPDGKKIAFISSRSGSTQIWVSDADGSNEMQLTDMRNAAVGGDSQWSPDGERIVFDCNSDGHQQVYMIRASGGKAQRMTNPPIDNALPSYSQDGRWIYFTSFRMGGTDIWKVPSGGGEPTRVTDQGGSFALESPDGQFLYYVKSSFGSALWRRPVGGGKEERILESVKWMNFAVREKGIYFTSEPGLDQSSSIQYFDFAKGAIRTLGRVEKLELGLSVSSDERYILYTQLDQAGSNLMLIENFR